MLCLNNRCRFKNVSVQFWHLTWQLIFWQLAIISGFVAGAERHLTGLPANGQHRRRDHLPPVLPRLQRGWTGPTDRKIRRKFTHYILVLRSRELVYYCREGSSLDHLTCSTCTMYILYLLFIIIDIQINWSTINYL